MAVSPFPLQSTMLLLHVHMAGQEPPPTLHACMPDDSWWPGNKERWGGGISGGECEDSHRCASASGSIGGGSAGLSRDYGMRLTMSSSSAAVNGINPL